MNIYEIAVVGGGPSGCMAAITAAGNKKSIVLIEKNDSLGKKLLLTGKGRCNITNYSSLDVFIEKFHERGNFYRTAFNSFFNQELVEFFESRGLKMKIERQNRVFPVSDKASSVLKILQKELKDKNVEVIYNSAVVDVSKESGFFRIHLSDSNNIFSKKVILAQGGASYRVTGSCGDGFRIAKKLGHNITPLIPGLVPLKTKEKWVKELQGLALRNIRITFKCGKKKIASSVGELMFTHFGVSGPLVLDLSVVIAPLLKEEVALFIDLKPALDSTQVEIRLLNEFKTKKNTKLKNIMHSLLPQRLIPVFLKLSHLNGDKTGSSITRAERHTLIYLMKSFPLTITETLGIDYAMVTCSGVSIKDINPRTMESKLVPGLYFAGEIIEGCAESGGYNLQQAFSTGFLAAEQVSK